MRKSSENSGIFRPFDEPNNKGNNDEEEDNHHHRSKTSSSSLSPMQQTHKNTSHHYPGSYLPSSSIHDKANSSHFSNPFMRKDDKSSSSSSEVLSIPVLRVPPQSHMTSDVQPRTNHHSHISNSTTSVETVVKNRSTSSSSSSSLLSNNVQNRIERFDFKSLARECTTTPSGSPPPLVQQPPPSSFSSTSSLVPQQPAFTGPYRSLYSKPHHHILESTPFSLPALMESAFHEDLLLRQRRSLSKLDVEEKRMKELGRRSEDSDGELEEVEEKMTARLTMIGRITPLPLETSEDKMNFLEAVGLTTHDRKKELQVRKEMRRRRLQRLASVSPVLLQCDEPVLDGTNQKGSSKSRSPGLFTRLMQASRSGGKVDEMLLNEMDCEEKAQFFKQLGMLPQSHAEQSDIEMKSLSADSINAQHNGLHQENCLKRKHEDAQDVLDVTENRLQPETKKLSSNPPLPLISSPSSSLSSSSLRSSLKEKDNDKSEFLPKGAKIHRKSPPLLNNQVTTRTDTQTAATPLASKSNHSTSSNTTQASSSKSASSSKLLSPTQTTSAPQTPASLKPDPSSSSVPPVIFPSHPLVNNNNALHSSFAEEFHKSVLQDSFSHHHKQHQQTQQSSAKPQSERSADIRDIRAGESHHRPSSSPQPPRPLSATKQHHHQHSAHLNNNNNHHQHSPTPGGGHSSSSVSSTGALSSKLVPAPTTNDLVAKRHNPTSTESLVKPSQGTAAAIVGGQPQPSHPSPQLLSQAALAGLYPWPGGLNAMMESYQRQHGGGSSSLQNGEHQVSDLRRN